MCTICDLRIEFSVDHPLSLSVAVETRRSVDAGLLPEPDSFEDFGTEDRLRAKAAGALRDAQRRLEQVLAPDELLALPDFFVFLIESRTWGFFHPTPNGFDPNCRPAPPNVTSLDEDARDAVLVGSQFVLSQIVAGRLPFGRALQERIMALDAGAPRRALLLNAWSRAYPEVGFSRFVCA